MSTITPSSIEYITQMLGDPGAISGADNESIKALTDAYPYFLPARYMEAAGQHKSKAFAQPMMGRMQLYMGNWLQFSKFLDAAHGEYTLEDTEVAEEIPEVITEAPEAVIEEVQEQETPITAEAEMPAAEVEEPVAAQIIEEDDEPSLDDFSAEHISFTDDHVTHETDETLILPIYTEDYFFHQGMQVSNDIPEHIETMKTKQPEEDKSLMVVMSFAEWLLHFKTNNEKEQEEKEDKKALKTMWQKEKLAAAMEEENEEIPENVFEMAVNSITKEEDLASEALADIYIKQGKHDKAVEMYRKLSLRNPQKSAYFARKIEQVLKERNT